MILLVSCTLFLYRFTQSREPYFIRNGNLTLKVSLIKKSAGSSYIISADCSGETEREISEWKLNYPVFHFECADINADGNEDILVGVIKPTRYDSISRKRIFIFKLIDGYIRPLWLGSRMSQPLEDFSVVRLGTINLLRTIEFEQNEKYLVADYKWQGFGFTFVKYVIRNSSIEDARKILTK